MKVVSQKIGLCRELLGYFGLFLIRFCKEGKLSGKKKRKKTGWAGVGRPSAPEMQESGCGASHPAPAPGELPSVWSLYCSVLLEQSVGMGGFVCVQGELGMSSSIEVAWRGARC